MDITADRELEMIREDAHQTRAKLAGKLEALESQVSQTVSGVTSAVETVTNSVAGVTSAVESVAGKVTDTVATVTESVTGTVSNLSESVSGTVRSVQESLDVSSHVQNHPWMAVGCAFAAGLAGGYLTAGSRHSNGTGYFGNAALPPAPTAAPKSEYNGNENAKPATAHVVDAVSEIGGAVKSLGISALMGVVSRLVRSAVPEALKSDVSGAIDKLKTQLGGHHDVPAELFDPK